MESNIDKLEEILENFRDVKYRIENEGIDYCFEHYSSFKEIEDEQFHELRLEFLNNISKLRSYVDNKIEIYSEQIDDLMSEE